MRCRTGRAAGSRTCSRRRARRSCSRAARSATPRAARSSRAASRPRCSGASAPASRRSSTSRCSAPRCGRCRTTSCRRRSCGANRQRHVAGKSLGSVLVGSYRTADERWLSLNMLDPERHWEPTCRALGLDELHRPARIRDRGATRRTLARAAPDLRRAHRLADARRAEGTALGAGHDLLADRVAGRGHQRPAGDRERLSRASSRAPDRAPVVVTDAVRRSRAGGPARRARDRRAHRRSVARARRRRRRDRAAARERARWCEVARARAAGRSGASASTTATTPRRPAVRCRTRRRCS